MNRGSSALRHLGKLLLLLWGSNVCANAEPYDLLIQGGLVFDGLGNPPQHADVGIRGDRIVAVGQLREHAAATRLDANGLTVAPGFINMLSWAQPSLLVDGRGMSDLKQGVTLQVFGEGDSLAPITAAEAQRLQDPEVYPTNHGRPPWRTFAEMLRYYELHGVAANVASMVGATTVRRYVLGDANRAATPDELKTMQSLVDDAMRQGAMGVGAALIYAPGTFANTAELKALNQVAARYDGLYTVHLRSEGDRLLQAIDEFLDIVHTTGVRGEIYHLKASGQQNWPRLAEAIHRLEAARAAGVPVSANMYTYTAGSTGLDAAMPPWAQAGGTAAWIERLQDPTQRVAILQAMRDPAPAWENLMQHAGAEGMLLVGFDNPDLQPLTGMTLAAAAAQRGEDPFTTAMNLVIENGKDVSVVYQLMSAANLRRKLATPWISFGSDARALATEPTFMQRSTHPRAYGNFARLLGRFVRDEQVLSLTEAIRRLTSLPATRLRLQSRGQIRPGYFADLVMFDAARINDLATYDSPHQYAEGVQHVIVNGTVALRAGTPTGALPGRALFGPGYQAGAQAPLRKPQQN